MESIIWAVLQSIPGAIAVILPVVLALTVVTSIVVEVLKDLTWGKLPANVLALIVAMAVTLLALVIVCQIMYIAVTWYMVAAAVVLGFFVCFAAMFGYDKLKQTLEQMKEIRRR